MPNAKATITRVTGALWTAVLLLLLTLSLCGCAPAAAGAEPPVTHAPDTSSAAAIRQALLGERSIHCSPGQDTARKEQEVLIGDIPAYYNPDSAYTRLWRFTLVDLDSDGETEAVVQIIDAAGDMGGYLVLHFLPQQQLVQGCFCDYRWFEALKTDGTFTYSSTAGWGVSGPFRFDETTSGGFSLGCALWQEPPGQPSRWYADGAEVSRESFEAALARQGQKADALWYDFTTEELSQGLPDDPHAPAFGEG